MVRTLPPLRLLLAGLLLVPLLPGQEAGSRPGRLTLVHTNDFHGQMLPRRAFWLPREQWVEGQPPRVGGAAALAGYLGAVRAAAAAAGGEVLFLDSGDWFQGTPEGNETGGRVVVELFNRLGCAVTVVGNHDFDLGWRRLIDLVGLASFPVLGANVLPPGLPAAAALPGPLPPPAASFLRPFWVKKVHGVRLLFFGLVLQGAAAVTGGDLGGHDFAPEERVLRAWLPVLRAEGDQILLLSHCGIETDRRLAASLEDVPELVAILGGHSHTRLVRPAVLGHIRIFQTGGTGTAVNHVEYLVHPERRELEFSRSRLVDLTPEAAPPDPATAAWLEEGTREIRERWDVPAGTLSGELWRTGAPRSSAAGNLVADATRRAGKADVGLANKGGLRVDLPAGPVTRRDVFELMPFDNEIVVLELAGAELLKVLDEGLRRNRGAVEVSGLTVLVREGRVAGALLADGSSLQPEAALTVAANSYQAGPGDQTGILAAAKRRRATGILVREALLELVREAGHVAVPGENRYRNEADRRGPE